MKVLAAVFILISLCGLQESQARPQISLENLLMPPNYQLMPPFIPIRIAACPTCQLLGYKPMEVLPGSFPFTATAFNNNNGNILTDRVPGAWSSFPALNRPPQPVQLPTSTLITALISYINYLRQNLDSMANANKNCTNDIPLDTSNVNTINQPTFINSVGAANQMVTSVPSWSRTSIQSKPASNNETTHN